MKWRGVLHSFGMHLTVSTNLVELSPQVILHPSPSSSTNNRYPDQSIIHEVKQAKTTLRPTSALQVSDLEDTEESDDSNVPTEQPVVEEKDDNIPPTESEDHTSKVTATSNIPCSESSTKFVDTVKCIPNECKTPRHFITNKHLLADPKGFMFLATFPGSGNTWTRAVIQEGTRIWTSSVHHDKSLFDEGYLGEYNDNEHNSYPTVSAIKVHYPYYKKIPYTKTAAVIEIIRSPFDALMAEFQRTVNLKKFRQHPNSVDPHVTSASPEEFHTIFPNWIKKASAKWLEYADFWLGKRLWERSDVQRCDANGVTSFVINSDPDLLNANRTIPILVLFYEDMKHNFPETSFRLFSFLKQRLGDAMLVPDTSVLCALQDQKHTSVAHRASCG
jgi:hypothetical protein